MAWDQFKKGFDRWENTTASYLETVMKNRSVLEPAGRLLSAAFRVRARVNGTLSGAWESLGLPTRRDQERTLHALNQLQSRLLDLEEKLDALNKKDA